MSGFYVHFYGIILCGAVCWPERMLNSWDAGGEGEKNPLKYLVPQSLPVLLYIKDCYNHYTTFSCDF